MGQYSSAKLSQLSSNDRDSELNFYAKLAESVGWLERWCLEDFKEGEAPPLGMPEFELRILSIALNLFEASEEPRICRPLLQIALNPYV